MIRVLAVWWEDAMSHDEWADKSETAAFVRESGTTVTVGLEVVSNDSAVVLACSMNPGQAGGIWRIPRGMVKRVKVLGRIEAPTVKE